MGMKFEVEAGDGDKAQANQVAVWLKEIETSRKREKDFRKDGRRVVKLYEADSPKAHQFNILYSNTETILPALYNNTPIPVVQRRFRDEDPTGGAASRLAERVLKFFTDPNNSSHASFDDLIGEAVLSALVPGRGVTRFKYDAEMETVVDEAGNRQEIVKSEGVFGDAIDWDRILYGYAKRWEDVPWIAFEHFMTREELDSNFPDFAGKIPLDVNTSTEHDGDDEGRPMLEDAKDAVLGHVYEIWDKTTKRVYFIAPSKKDTMLKAVDDPLQLSGFFPCPKPLVLFRKLSSLVPVPLYRQYEEQAKELNRITSRINKLVSMLKVRGFYDGNLELSDLLSKDDGVLIPTTQAAALLQEGRSLDNFIWLMPLEKIVQVLQQLYVQREQCKAVIFEIMGIADILRGASKASETLGAQEIKNNWSSLRLRRLQKIVQQYVKECLRIVAEISFTKLAPDTLKRISGLDYPTREQQMQVQQQMQMLQQMPGPDGQPQQPPQQMLAILELPSWEDILGLLSNDLQRNYRIDIESNSTVDAEATDDKQEMGEFMNAFAQFLNGIAPIVEKGYMPFEVAKAVMLTIVRRYRFGSEVEDELKKMAPPQAPPEKDDGSAAKAEGEKVKLENEKMRLQGEMQMAQAEAQLKIQAMQMEAELAKREAEAKMLDLQRKGQLADLQFRQKVAQMTMKMKEQALAQSEPSPVPARTPESEAGK